MYISDIFCIILMYYSDYDSDVYTGNWKIAFFLLFDFI